MNRTLKKTLLLATAAAALAACSSAPLAPSSDVAVPAQWWTARAAADPSAATKMPEQWMSLITDPQLRKWVSMALENNRDLRVAALQIEQSAAQYQVQRAGQWPNIGLGLNGTHTDPSTASNPSGYTSGLTMTSWEIDVFGRISHLKDAALAQYLATQEARDGVQASLVASVANTWLAIQADDALLELTRQTLTTREESLRLTRLRFNQGTASALDLQSAQSLAESARVALAQTQRQRALDVSTLAVLVGQPLSQPLDVPVANGAGALQALAEVPVGLPSDVLLQRPDIRVAEHQLAAAHAQVDAARAALFPQINLTASLGSASSSLSGLFQSGTWGWSLASQTFLPLFDGGRRRGAINAADAGQKVALAQYEKAIQTAFKEVNDALIGQSTLAQQAQAQQALVKSESERYRLSQRRLQQGVASQLDVLDAQRSLFSAQQADIQVRLAAAQNRVALFKALGGGWQVPATPSVPVADTASQQPQAGGKL